MSALNPEAAAADLMAALRPQTPPEPLRARRISTATQEDADMTTEQPKRRRGRPPKNPDAPQQKRKYTRREKPAEDMKALAAEALISAALHLAETVRSEVEIGDNSALIGALRQFEVAQKIHAAAR